MKATTSKPAASKTATKETKKAATETKATPVLNEASVTIIAETENKAQETPFYVDHNLIAQTAYFLWQTEGCQPGLDEEYWLRAEASLQPKK